jgi:hypothetical protein
MTHNDNDGTFNMGVHFSIGTCDDCGAIHPASTRCVCGAPRDFDDELDRRRALVTAAMRDVIAADPTGTPGDPHGTGWYARIESWFPSLFAACQHIAENREGPGTLNAVLVDLITVRADLAATPQWRPYLHVWANLNAALDTFETAADHYVVAITAPDVEAATTAAEDGQAAIDKFTVELDAFSTRINGWATVLEEVEAGIGEYDLMLRIIELARSRNPDAGITEFDQSGQHLVERVTGGLTLPSVGAQLLLVETLADVLLDPERLWRTAARTFRAVTFSASTLTEVASSPHWRSDYEKLTQELVDLGVEVRRATFESPRMAARNFVRIGHLLTERVGKYLLATVLAARGGRDYEALRSKDVGALLGEIAQADLDDLTFGWDKALRHGDAHGEFEAEDDGVRFTADKREYDFLTWDELGDRVLGAYESVVAVHAGLQCALEVVGVGATDAIETLDIPLEDRVRVALALVGWTDVTVEVTATSVAASGTATTHPEAPVFVAAATAYLPENVTDATFAITADDGTTLWAGPLGPLRAFSAETDPLTKVTWFLESMLRWTVDNEPVWPETKLRGMVAAHLVDQPDTPTDRIAALDPLMALARRIGDRDLYQTLSTLRGGYQSQRYGREPAKSFHRAVLQLVGYYESAQALDDVA